MASGLTLCKYKFDNIGVIFEDGSTYTIPSRNVFYFSIEKDFFNDFLPILNVKCLVSNSIYKKVNKCITKFKISIKKFFVPVNSSTTFNKKSANIMYKKFISDVFINVNNSDSSIDNTKDLKDKISKNTTRTAIEEDNVELDLLLFTEESLNYRKLNDKIFSNGNMMNVLLALSELTNQGKILMTYPDNKTFYDDTNIIIPNNLTFLGCVKYLQNVYGIYNNGYILFRDFDKLFLVDKSLNCNAYQKGEFKRVYMRFGNLTDDNSNIYGQINNNSNKSYLINCISAPAISTNSTSTNELLFDNLHVMNTYSGKSSTESVDMMKSTANKTTKVIEDKYDNKFAINSTIYEINLNNYNISTTFNEVDVDILTPNKEFFFDIKINDKDYKKISGLVKLSRFMAVFDKGNSTDDEMFNCVVNAEFKRA